SITLPLSVFLGVFAPDIVRLVFARGAFDETAVALTSGAMRGICWGLWAGTLGMILLRHLNNQGRNGAVALLLAAAFATAMLFNICASYLPVTHVGHAILLGSAESARGVVLLAGVAFLLKCHAPLLRMLALWALPTATLTALSWFVLEHITSGVMRVLAGGA